MKHAKRSGWRPFWAALCAALLVLLPLVGGTVLLSRAQLRSSLRQAAKSQSGVPIRLPKAADQCTVLLCVADETPGFVLAYLNAGQNCIHLLAVPAALEVPFGGKMSPLRIVTPPQAPPAAERRWARCLPCRRIPIILPSPRRC